MLKEKLEDIEEIINTAENLMYVIYDFIEENDFDKEVNEHELYELRRNASQATKISNGVIELLKQSQDALNKITKEEIIMKEVER